MIRRLTQAALLATVGAAVIGVARHRAESARVARGELPRASAAADVPAGDHGPVAARLAGWVPAPPTTAAGRVVTSAWAAPLTVVGLLVAVVSGRRPRWSPEHGCFVAEGVGGLSSVALRSVGAQANTIGQVVLSRRDHMSPTLLAHEVVHVRQGERLGPLLLPVYVWLAARYGYRRHPLEHAARLGARRRTSGD